VSPAGPGSQPGRAPNARVQHAYHIESFDVTDGDEGDDGSRLTIRLDTGKTFTPAEDWLDYLMPKPGEAFDAFWIRVVTDNPFLRIIPPHPSLSGWVAPPLDRRRPAELTLEWWAKTFPDKFFSWFFDEYPRNYHMEGNPLWLM
jgi:hypothetical protein